MIVTYIWCVVRHKSSTISQLQQSQRSPQEIAQQRHTEPKYGQVVFLITYLRRVWPAGIRRTRISARSCWSAGWAVTLG
jgi:hypothetical protein